MSKTQEPEINAYQNNDNRITFVNEENAKSEWISGETVEIEQ